MKKSNIIAIFAVLILALSITPTAHAATYEYPVDGGNLYFDPTTGTITYCGRDVYNAVIPDEIYGIPVTAIGPQAFSLCTKLTSVTIPDSVKSIGHGAFMSCTALTSIIIPNSVAEIEHDAFHTCEKLETVSIPGSIKELPRSLFFGCIKLKNLVLGEGIETIGRIFYECKSIETITIPDSVKEIKRYAFDGAVNLKSVTVGSGVKFIGKYAFTSPYLESIYFRGNVPGTNGQIIGRVASGFTIYYPEGASGWTTPTWNGFLSKPYTLPTSEPTPQPSLPSGTATATPTAATVQVNGQTIAFDAYNINGNNFFKLRDLAFVLSGSQVQFEVTWDQSANAIRMTSGKSYTPVGGEMAAGGKINQIAIPTASKLLLDWNPLTLTAYNINGNNYFKLRDLGEIFNFSVEWDGNQKLITIDTTRPYIP